LTKVLTLPLSISEMSPATDVSLLSVLAKLEDLVTDLLVLLPLIEANSHSGVRDIFLGVADLGHLDLLALEHHGHKIVELVVDLEDLFLHDLDVFLGLLFLIILVMSLQVVPELSGSDLHLSLKDRHFLDRGDVVVVWVAISEQTVPLGSERIVAESL